MKKALTQKDIGIRLLTMRKKKGLSQEELSKSIGISRSSLVQIELGNRNIDATVLKQLSMMLAFSMDEILATNFNPLKNERIEDEAVIDEIIEERIAVPKMNITKFKNVLLYILEKCAGKPNVGETVLYKLLYFSDFNYYEVYETHLSGARYRKLPFGPVPISFDAIITKMIEKKELQKIKTNYFNKVQTRYIPLVKANLTHLKASETDIIDNVLQQMSDWSATMISDYSHNDMPWRASKDGEELSYELAFYRKPPYSLRVYNEDDE